MGEDDLAEMFRRLAGAAIQRSLSDGVSRTRGSPPGGFLGRSVEGADRYAGHRFLQSYDDPLALGEVECAGDDVDVRLGRQPVGPERLVGWRLREWGDQAFAPEGRAIADVLMHGRCGMPPGSEYGRIGSGSRGAVAGLVLRGSACDIDTVLEVAVAPSPFRVR